MCECVTIKCKWKKRERKIVNPCKQIQKRFSFGKSLGQRARRRIKEHFFHFPPTVLLGYITFYMKCSSGILQMYMCVRVCFEVLSPHYIRLLLWNTCIQIEICHKIYTPHTFFQVSHHHQPPLPTNNPRQQKAFRARKKVFEVRTCASRVIRWSILARWTERRLWWWLWCAPNIVGLKIAAATRREVSN